MPNRNPPDMPQVNVNPDDYAGGIGGFKSLSIKPVGGYSATLDMHLRAYMDRNGPKSMAGVIAAHWPHTLDSSEQGAAVLEKLRQIRSLEKEVYQMMKQSFVEDNAMSVMGQQAQRVDGAMDEIRRRLGDVAEDQE